MPLFGDRARALEQRLARLGIRDEDLEESFVHSGGKGGQNVNKVATCVVLVHRPTRIAVKCQRERTQGANRLIARQMLADKIEELRLGAVRFTEVPLLLTDAAAGAEANPTVAANVGERVMRRYNLVLDYRRNVIRFETPNR